MSKRLASKRGVGVTSAAGANGWQLRFNRLPGGWFHDRW
jgi:hypothetical protein